MECIGKLLPYSRYDFCPSREKIVLWEEEFEEASNHCRVKAVLWAEEFKVKKVISNDALKLFCMRTSKDVKIGRNGVYDSQFGITYWGEWMICEKGRKVFL